MSMELIDGLTLEHLNIIKNESGGGSSTTVVNNLLSSSATSALSANQGKILSETKQEKSEIGSTDTNYVNVFLSTLLN
jgi:hypothetical protein